jgi:hypothetical protein
LTRLEHIAGVPSKALGAFQRLAAGDLLLALRQRSSLQRRFFDVAD